jgi:cytochrome c peroxidase
VTRAALRVVLGAALAGVATAGPAPPERPLGHADVAYTYGVGTFRPEYAPPAPGSYELPAIDDVTDHPLIDADGRETSLFALKGERLAVVAFIYTSCAESTGCPVGNAALQRVDRRLAEDPGLARRVTLVTVSFDPERDTSARMAEFRTAMAPKTDWRFATTGDDARLQPLLADFGQPVAKLRQADGAFTGAYRHVLKVFLLDGENRVRNVYSVGFLHPDLVLNDLRTLALAETAAAR